MSDELKNLFRTKQRESVRALRPAAISAELDQTYKRDKSGKEIAVGPPTRRLTQGTKEEQQYFRNLRNKTKMKAFVGTSPVPDH